ncbi:MAG: GNAT family N-acetyltransferase [Lachnospiraceae bacterium]
MKAEELWNEFCEKKSVRKEEPYTAWAFCGGGPAADELLSLVLEGKKFGTASIYEDYLMEGEDIPGDREYSIVLDSKGNAACVIRNFEVKVEPFYRVSEYHGYSEGEEERNLTAWRRIHENYWKPDFERLHIDSAKNCHVVMEKFTVEYVAPTYPHAEDLISDFYFIEPNIRYAEQIIEYRNKMIEANSSMDGCLSLKRMPDPKEWVEYSYEWGNPLRNLGENGIRGTLLMCIRKTDENIVGMVQIRKIPAEHEKSYVGHIGYSVRPDERKKGYAKMMLKKSLEYLKYGLMVDKAELSVLPENEASKKTILSQGGYYRDTVYIEKEEETLERYFIELGNI